jgi:hypothetical protein
MIVCNLRSDLGYHADLQNGVLIMDEQRQEWIRLDVRNMRDRAQIES